MKNKFWKIILPLMFSVFTLGSCGFQGPQGEPGTQGEKGEQGNPGKDGSSVLSGVGAPSSELGKTGDLYVETVTGLKLGILKAMMVRMVRMEYLL